VKTQLVTSKPVHLEITLKPGVWIDPGKFIKQIADAGYAARKDDIRLTLTGKVTKEGDRLYLSAEDLRPNPEKFLLVQGAAKNPSDIKARIDAFTEVSGLVGQASEVEGLWKPADTRQDRGPQPTLTVIRVGHPKPVVKDGK
jgi:hypothetical protein